MCVHMCAHMCARSVAFASLWKEQKRNSNATALLRACLPPPGFRADSSLVKSSFPSVWRQGDEKEAPPVPVIII